MVIGKILPAGGVLQELEQLQQRINDCDVNQVVDLVLNDILDNDSTKMELPLSGQEVTNPLRSSLALLGGTSENLLKLDSLSDSSPRLQRLRCLRLVCRNYLQQS
jgi:hypothetical protein